MLAGMAFARAEKARNSTDTIPPNRVLASEGSGSVWFCAADNPDQLVYGACIRVDTFAIYRRAIEHSVLSHNHTPNGRGRLRTHLGGKAVERGQSRRGLSGS